MAKTGFDMVVDMMDVDKVNSIFRENLLNEDGVMILELSKLSMLNEGELYSGTDMLTETTAKLTEVRLKGLDTLTKLQAFEAIGKYTLETSLEWTELSIECDLELKMKPSSADDAVIISNNDQVVESVTIKTGIKGLKLNAGLLLVLELDKIDDVELGSILYTERIVGCILSVVNRMEFSTLSLVVDDIVEPTMSGFLSPGIDRVVNTIVDAAFVMFEPSVLRALPGVFDTMLKEMLNTMITDFRNENSGCEKVDVNPIVQTYGETLDFNYLFQSEVGPYGDVFGYVVLFLSLSLTRIHKHT